MQNKEKTFEFTVSNNQVVKALFEVEKELEKHWDNNCNYKKIITSFYKHIKEKALCKQFSIFLLWPHVATALFAMFLYMKTTKLIMTIHIRNVPKDSEFYKSIINVYESYTIRKRMKYFL